jgi:hypothetical protein
MSEPSHTPFELVGDQDVGMCVDGVCEVPRSEIGGPDHRERDVGP